MTNQSAARPESFVKIMFRLDPGAWHGSATETVWAEPLGPRRYRLANTPFYAFGVSLDDEVVTDENDMPVFAGVINRGGHSTYRLIKLDKGLHRDAFDKFWKPLRALGCTYEEGRGALLAVDVPAGTNIFEVYETLESGERAGIWSFEEGHCGHPT